MKIRLRLSAGIALGTLLAGCAVGPDFQRPADPAIAGYSPRPLATIADQRLAPGADIVAQWWTLFESPALNQLIAEAFASHPDIEAAQAALRQAQENVAAQRGYFYPVVQASYAPSRTKVAGNNSGAAPGIQGDGTLIAAQTGKPANQGGSAPYTAPVIYNFHTAQLSVGYSADVFGANSRQVEALEAQAEAQRYVLEATYITLASNVVAAAIQEAALRAQIEAVQAMVAGNARALAVLRRRQEAGYASGLDLALQESQAAQAEQWLPPLTRQLEQTRNLLRLLTGKGPDQELAQTFTLDALQLPRELPLSLPSQLVRQRPDIRAAEALLHAASAQVGVAVANRLPQFALSANLGGQAAHFGQMFADTGKFFSVVGTLSQTLFDGGTLRHRQRAAEAALDQAGAQYRATVLAGFQNVADTLLALQADAANLQAAQRAELAARKAYDLARKQQAAGYSDTLALLTAEQAWRQASFNLTQSRAQRLGDTAALFQALGGGWWNRGDATLAAGTETSAP
ncbi:efflux transporter outer membrane subunit [Denitratisoma sp. agr-D3]